MTSAERQKRLLMLLGVLLLFLTWRYLLSPLLSGGDDAEVATRPTVSEPGDDEAPARRRPASSAQAESQGARPGDRVEILRVAELDRTPRPLVAGRDPWRFVDPPPPPPPKPAPPPPPPSAEDLARLERERLAALERARLAAIEAAKPKPPQFTMDYLGYFGPADRKIAVFTNGKTQINALEGEVIQNQFIVESIGYESVAIRFVGFPNEPAKRVGIRRR